MSVPQKFAFTRIGAAHSPSTLEVYIDPVCPFSRKITESIDRNILPMITNGGKYDGTVNLVVRLYPQPFHYYSAPIIEALYVFGQTNPRLFWQYLLAVHSTGTTFYNRPAASLTLSSLRDKLVEIAVEQVLDKDEASGKGPKSKIFGELRDGLEVKASDNGGNEGTEGLKYSLKLGRQNGIQVTPTALWNGLKDESVSSSYGKEEWEKYFTEKTG
ncbi:hypothetical protein IAS59_005541 [Cryptococcus gattii]